MSASVTTDKLAIISALTRERDAYRDLYENLSRIFAALVWQQPEHEAFISHQTLTEVPAHVAIASYDHHDGITYRVSAPATSVCSTHGGTDMGNEGQEQEVPATETQVETPGGTEVNVTEPSEGGGNGGSDDGDGA